MAPAFGDREMSNILKLTAVVTSVDIGTPVECADTPLLGGAGREAKLLVPDLPITSTVKLQGAGRQADDAAPAEDSTEWSDIVTLTSASDKEQQIVLPRWIRWNTTVLDADGPDVKVFIEGVQ